MPVMPTLIDESGDTGHSRNSLPYFRLAAVWLPDLDAAAAFRDSIRRLREELHLGRSFEFKFAATSSHPERRDAFFRRALDYPFQFAWCGLDKTTWYWSKAPAAEQHWATATSLAVCLRSTYLAAEQPSRPLRDQVLVDNNADKAFLHAINRAFRNLRSRLHPDAPMVANARFRGSAPDEAMQLVDMVCGATGAHLNGDSTWYNLIRSRCLGLMQLP
jgi:hypothetical protein